MLLLQERLDLLTQLGERLRQPDAYRDAVMKRAEFNNGWLTLANQQAMMDSIATQMLDPQALRTWVSQYDLPPLPEHQRTVGIVMAGNLPLVGFHDWLCVFVAGHRAQIKLSDKDKYLLPYVFKVLNAINPHFSEYYQLVEKLADFDAVIATGSNNSARYFEAYFGKYPHIIRKNRTAVAVLTGAETTEELQRLGEDVFRYFGLGCRNVSKLYLPEGYALDPLLEALHTHREIVIHSKYKNNFDYNFAVRTLNKAPFRANGCVMLIENEALHAGVATLHYEFYADLQYLENHLIAVRDDIQVVVSHLEIPGLRVVPFGKAQKPELDDYADGVDTVAFLRQLN